MNKKDKIIMNFVEELISAPQSAYEEAKATLLSVKADNKKMQGFISKAFEVAELHRPKLIAQK